MKVRTTITVDWDIPADSDLDEFHADLAEALDLIDLPYQQTDCLGIDVQERM